MPTIHFAQIENSPRLQRLHSFLSDGRWHSTWEIFGHCFICAVGTAVSELRSNGYHVDCRCVGQGRYEYRMKKTKKREIRK